MNVEHPSEPLLLGERKCFQCGSRATFGCTGAFEGEWYGEFSCVAHSPVLISLVAKAWLAAKAEAVGDA